MWLWAGPKHKAQQLALGEVIAQVIKPEGDVLIISQELNRYSQSELEFTPDLSLDRGQHSYVYEP